MPLLACPAVPCPAPYITAERDSSSGRGVARDGHLRGVLHATAAHTAGQASSGTRRPAFRFWQEGAGYDRTIGRRESVEAAVAYIHDNPVRKGLVAAPDRWPWSSWAAYHDPGGPADERLPAVTLPTL